MLIGITGTDGAGKGAVVDYLVSAKGFVHYSARAIWVEEIERRGIENSRASMRTVANELRGEHGNDYLIKYYLDKMADEKPENAVIESLRAIAEVETLRANDGILLAADADQKLRYERITARGSSSDNVSFEEFVRLEEIEMNDPDPNGMQKAAVIEMAEHTIMNNSTLEELHAKIEDVLTKITS
ncbi:AAA family ATPase [Candidatus Pacebacteria bacterium]|nr:AAA family ATPase [Candidatus Paceibacterota bacterium]